MHSHRCCCAETPKQATTGAEEHCWGTGGHCEGVLHVKVDLQRHTPLEKNIVTEDLDSLDVSDHHVTALQIIFWESFHRFCQRWADLLRQQAECWVQARHMHGCAH